MSKICVTMQENLLKIERKTARENIENFLEPIDINELEYNKEYKYTEININGNEKNKVFLLEKINEEDALIVYSDARNIKYSYCSLQKAYKYLIKLKYKVLKISMTKRKIKIKIAAYIINKYNYDISDIKFYIDGTLFKKCTLKQYSKKISNLKILRDKNIYSFEFKVNDLINDDSLINGSVRFQFDIDGNSVDFFIAMKRKKNIGRLYYLPIKSIYNNGFALHIRRSRTGTLVLVKRKMESIEYTFKFKLIESKIISFFLYKIGNYVSKIRKRKINLFYEKFSEKSEEGVFELCQKCCESKKSKNYFIIDKNMPDYEKIKQYRNVVKKYSLKYYYLFYSASNFISSDSPIHLNILRSNNKYLRKSMYNKKFIFLQHGITYLKCHEKNSPYIKGKESEPDFMIIGSEKEKDVVAEMLKLDESKLLNTGLPIFSKLKYNHISNNSDDIVTIMLTWKPYEEQLYNFEESSYYKNVIEIYNTLKNYIDENKIIIIGHPKANELLMNTDLKSSLWDKPISVALEKTKLLITDYSSVCYNSFYQGAGVIFYQPDLELYEKENGKLIPYDDEYIGKRAFSITELERILDETIINKKINLNKVRAKKFEENYKTINEFSDGKNIERIYSELKNLEII